MSGKTKFLMCNGGAGRGRDGANNPIVSPIKPVTQFKLGGVMANKVLAILVIEIKPKEVKIRHLVPFQIMTSLWKIR